MTNPPVINAQVLLALAGSLLVTPAGMAATVNQTANSSLTTTGWNTATLWGSTPSAGNDYVSTAGTGSTNIYTLNGTAWNQASWSVQDTTTGSASVSSTFGGDRLILSANTTLNGKANGGSTQTVNLVFNGGFYRGNSASTSNPSRSSTLDGTIVFNAPNTAGAIGVFSPDNNNSFTLNVDSAITGGAGNLLQLTMNGGGTNRSAFLNLNGDLSGFFGTIYAGVSTVGINLGVTNASRFSITTDASFATVQLDTTTTNFGYNLGSGNVTFGALRLGSGAGTAVTGNHVYTASDLNGLAGGTYFYGTGTITVVPEPGVTAVGAVALLGALVLLRARKIA